MAPALAPDYFVVRWSGFQPPATGNYLFGGAYDDQLRVQVAGIPAFTGSAPSAAVSFANATPVPLTAGQRVPIQVDYAEQTGNANVAGTTRPAG